MILFAGIPSEAPLRLAITEAEASNVPHLVVNQRHSTHYALALAWREGLEARLSIAGKDWNLADFSGVYSRMIEPASLPECRPRGRTPADPMAMIRAQTFSDLFTDWLDLTEIAVANRPHAMGSNLSKPYQAQIIQAHGLDTPETLVTNDPGEVLAFRARHGRIIYKSVGSVRSIVREWSPEKGPDLTRIKSLPTQFQAFVPGTNIRVHVCGDEVFATRIDCPAVDYRYAGRENEEARLSPMILPDAIAQLCRTVTARLGLLISGIDLKLTEAGQWYCFEVNPSPAYSYYEEQTGQPIARALVRALSA